MTLYIWQNGQQKDISAAVVKGSLRCKKCLSMDIDKPIGESTLDFSLYDDFELENVRFKPKGGERVQFKLDDGSGTVYFDGFLQSPSSESAGFTDTQKLAYAVQAKDVISLFAEKVMPEITFSGHNAGYIIDQLAAYVDARITPASDNDSGYTIGQKKLARMDIFQAVQELAKESGLMVWIDENWKIHHKLYSTLVGLAQPEQFEILDTSTTYKNFKTEESTEKLVTRVNVIGSQMDAGTVKPQNRKQGKQKRADNIITRTADLDKINYVRRARGYADLELGTDPETLPGSTPGIIEKDIDFQDCYDASVMARRAQIELDLYSDPWIKGSVSFYQGGLIPGHSILIDSEVRGIETALPVIEIELSTSEGSGFDADGLKQYFYTCQINGPSVLKKIQNKLTPPAKKEAKGELLIKPNPPTLKKHQTTESLTSLNATGVIIRSNKTY